MGEIADALRANLHQLAQADARLLRELDAILPADEFEGLSVKQLKQRCRELGLKGTSNLKRQELVARLRAAECKAEGTAARLRPVAQSAISPTPSTATNNDLTAVQARLDRLEALLVRIAQHLGVG